MARVTAANPRDELFFLVGPTASGKTALSLEVAERAGAEIVSMDSMLVYRGMDIGTAKPGPDERARVRHHLLDLVEPSETFTVQDWLAAASGALADIASRGKRALICGGTALYLKTLVHGMFEGPEVDRELRATLERRFEVEGPERLHAELAAVDPKAAARIHANDRKRVVRALEVHRQTGRPISEWQTEWESDSTRARPHRIVGLSLPTPELDARIARRTRDMLDLGWPAEAQRIHDSIGFGPTASQALGYAEALRLAQSTITRAEAERSIYLSTRRFARRQRTWFRRFPQTHWLRSPAAPPDLPQLTAETLLHFRW